MTLEDKVYECSLIAIVEVISVKLNKIDKHNNDSDKTQHVELKLKVTKLIYGKADKEILVNCYSTSFQEKNSIQSSTAGFSSWGISKGNKFIAYLKKKKGFYYLASSSNQYLEEIDEKKKTVTDIGQTYKKVTLKEKLEKLKKLSKEKLKKKGNQTVH